MTPNANTELIEQSLMDHILALEKSGLYIVVEKRLVQKTRERLERLPNGTKVLRGLSGQSYDGEAKMDNMADGDGAVYNDSEVEQTKKAFVARFVNPLFDRIEKNNTRLAQIKKRINEGEEENEAVNTTYDSMRTKTTSICQRKIAAMVTWLAEIPH